MRFNCKCGRPECDDGAKTTLRFKIFNEGRSTQRQPIDRKKIKKSSGSMTDIAKKLGIHIEEDLLTEDQIITESKADQQKFIDKFGKEFFDTFWNNKQRLKNKDINVDILWHVKHTSLSDMRKILDSISDEQRAQEVDIEGTKMPEPTGNYDVVFESEDYIVYHPHDYISSIYCAKGGRWCTAGGYNIPEGQVKVSQAKTYFNQYTGKGIELYYFIKSDGDRYALAVYPNGTSHEVYNKRDNNIGGVENIPGIENIEIDGLDLENMRGRGGASICDNCGESMSDEDIYAGPNGETYCESCFYDLTAFCSRCANIFDLDEVTEAPNGQWYCSSCLDELFVECGFCHEYVSRDEVYTADAWDVICQNCMDSGDYTRCAECDEVVSYENATTMDGEHYYCDSCFDALFQPCDGCGVVTPWDDLTRDTSGRKLCANCSAEVFGESLSTPTIRFRLVEDIAAVRKNYPKISDEDFNRIIRLDPTFIEGRDSVGQYGKWLLNLFNKGKLDNEGHARDALSRFEQEKKNVKNKDIGQFKSLDDIDAYLNDDDNYKNKSHRQEVRDRQKARKNADLSSDAEKVYEDFEWSVWIPKTYEASCKLGQGSSWCTATTENDHYYKHYSSQGPLYIILNRHRDDVKYQFHFESSQFMDIDDRYIDLMDFLSDNEGLYDYFIPIIYSYIGLSEDDIENGLITIEVYDEDDYDDIFGDQADFIYSAIGAEGDPFDLIYRFDFEFRDVDDIPSFSEFPNTLQIELIEAGYEDFEEDLYSDDDLHDAVSAAYSLAAEEGTMTEIREDIEKQLEYVDAEVHQGTVRITITVDELLDMLDEYFSEYNHYTDMVKAIFRYKFDLEEPYYGWYGFDNAVFYEELSNQLGLLVGGRGE